MSAPDNDIAIKVDHVSKAFKLPHEKSSSVKSLFVSMFHGKRTYERQQVLKDVSFEIKKGEFFGIVGRNGSGKSTLLKLLAGIYTPDKGHIQVNGKLTPFIELGVGFNPELTGRENVFLNGALLGFNRKEMEAMYEEIVEFAELEKFMDQKLKNYSSGMQVRLAFSIAIRAQGAILLLDEVLAVGDALFQKKCYDYFKQLKKEKKTVVFVSHDAGALQEYCTNGILLEKGDVLKSGSIDTIVKDYIDILNKAEGKTAEAKSEASRRWGTGAIRLSDIRLGKENKKSKVYTEGEDIEISATFISNQDIESPVFGVTITDLTGQVIFQSNTLWCKIPVKDVKKNQNTTVRWVIPNAFTTGTYEVSPGCSDRTGTETFDWVDGVIKFKVQKDQKSHGIINMEHKLMVAYD